MAGAGGAKPREESTETGLRAMRGVGGLGPSSSPPPPRGKLGQAPPPSPKCPTIQMASIPEVTLPGGGGSDKVTFPLFSLLFLPPSY